MSKTIHILNGDSTLHQLKASGIQGDTFVWKDVLSDGPVRFDFGSDEFWSQRDQFMTAEFNLAKDEFSTGVVAPFKEMQASLPKYDEVVLWFEYDLFCQINMIALITWLGKLNLENTTSLICLGKIDDSEKLFGLGQINASQYTPLFETRLKLGSREFDFCSDVHEAYCHSDPNELYNYVLMSLAEFPYLPDALDTHFRRFPNQSTGLTAIEHQMIDFISEGESDQRKLVGKMLRWQRFYGFGDSQYFNTLNRLRPLFENFENLVLKPKLNKELVESLLNRNRSLGGASLSDWYWDDQEKTLTPREPAL